MTEFQKLMYDIANRITAKQLTVKDIQLACNTVKIGSVIDLIHKPELIEKFKSLLP